MEISDPVRDFWLRAKLKEKMTLNREDQVLIITGDFGANFFFNYRDENFKENDFFQQGLEHIQKYDNIKNQWCFDNNIKIIRIPYTHLEKITIKDLLVETSDFILKEE